MDAIIDILFFGYCFAVVTGVPYLWIKIRTYYEISLKD